MQINGSGEINVKILIFTLFENTNMADTQIIGLLDYRIMIISSWVRPDLVAWWLACWTLEPEDQCRFACGHLLYLVFFFFFFSVIIIQVIHDI